MKGEVPNSTSYFDYFWIWIIRQFEVDMTIDEDEL